MIELIFLDVQTDVFTIVSYLLVGGVAGWLSGLIMHGKSFGIIRNIVIGIIGGIIGGWLFQFVGIDVGYKLGGSLITAVVGAIVLIAIARMIKK